MMTPGKSLTAIGLMSGTSMDGIDAALIETDGERVGRFGPVVHMPYDEAFRLRLRGVLGQAPDACAGCAEVASDLTHKHAEAVKHLLDRNGIERSAVDIVGFHGHTVLHRPERRETFQIGDGALLARATGLAVIDDFRSADVAAGGQGAPLAALYHAALARDLDKPLAVLNVGGVANVTWIGEGGDLLAFDTGPGNALIDDWARHTIHKPMDEGGKLARAGTPDATVLSALLSHPYFEAIPPKSLDRLDFSLDAVAGLSPEDGAATLTAFTAEAVKKAPAFLPAPPKRWLVCGGGRHNGTLMDSLRAALGVTVEAVEAVGWSGDALEAQAFGFLAVRSLYGLPLTVPGTTGIGAPMTGGRLHRP
jgi:anhydro-N-acetylmuramic acid kinase